MKISKIRDKITDSGDFNGHATIYQYPDFVKCIFLLMENGKRTRRTSKYSFIDFDIPVSFDSCTILKWDEAINDGFGLRYINYYDERH